MWKLNDSSEETARDRLQRKTHCDRKIQANLKMIKSLEYLTKEVTQTTSTRDGCEEQLVALCKLSSASTTTAHLLESLNQMDTDRKCWWVCGATGTLIHYPWEWKTTDTVWKTGRYCVISTYTCHLTKESHCVCVCAVYVPPHPAPHQMRRLIQKLYIQLCGNPTHNYLKQKKEPKYLL